MKHAILITIAALFVYGFGKLVGQNSRQFNGYSLMMVIVLLNQLIQIIVFIPSKIFNSQRFYDLTGSLTYISMTSLAFFTQQSYTIRSVVAAGFVYIWALRLGSFLFLRILKVGEDSRFQVIKKRTIVFLFAWFIQGVWVTLTASPVFVFLSKNQPMIQETLKINEYIGVIFWVIGFMVQIISDNQKSKFNENPKNQGQFISTGLWRYSRHPNYCGQVILWIGVTIFMYTSLEGYEKFTMISPIFVYFLLTKLSGVPILEKKAIKKWGQTKQYQQYISKTPVMFFGTNTIKGKNQ